jgi:Mn2+/Fe2+ NRAMP family transporter
MWDPIKLEKEKTQLRELSRKPFFERSFGYIRRTGPGLLQSAMTLGAGSAAASVVAGASFGYKLLWVQPLAMFLGVLMFAAIANIVLTTRERPYKAFMRELSIVLIFLWAFGTVTASVIWHFPQYALAAGAARNLVQEFKPDLVLESQVQDRAGLLGAYGNGELKVDGNGNAVMTKVFTRNGIGISFLIGLIILVMNMTVVFNYGSGGRGIRLYEWFLRGIIALTIVMFFVVVLVNCAQIQWLEVLKGFVGWYGIPNNGDPIEYGKAVTTVLGMLGAAVGINMTFLYPYSLLAKGWGEEHKTLVKWDLAMTMFLPFTIVTSLIIVTMTVTGVYDGRDIVNSGISAIDAAKSLHSVFGDSEFGTKAGRLIFCTGLIGMTCGAISTHMVVCGFTICEMLGLDYTKTRFRLFAMTPSIGVLGVVFQLPFWFPVAASALCLTMLPIAYLIFIVLSNKRSFIGNAVGKGLSRELFNIGLSLALLLAIVGAIIKVKGSVIDKIFPVKKADVPAVVQPITSNK